MPASLPDLRRHGDAFFSAKPLPGDGVDLKAVRTRGLRAAVDEWAAVEDQRRELLRELREPPRGESTIRAADATTTADLFGRFGTEIAAALLLASLPQAFAFGRGASLLLGAGGLTFQPRRRIRETAQFLVTITTPPVTRITRPRINLPEPNPDEQNLAPLWGPQGSASIACADLRILHQTIRQRVPADARPQGDVPINQADLTATMLSFTVVVFDALERLGLSWTAEQQQRYINTWNEVGLRLGIAPDPLSPNQGRPATVTEGRAWLMAYRDDVWHLGPHYHDFDDRLEELYSGRVLYRRLLQELVAAMPRTQKSWPAAIIRQLAEPQVRNRLAMGGRGFVEQTLATLPARTITVGRFTHEQTSNALQAALLRAACRQIARRAILYFILDEDGPPFELPGLGDLTEALRSRGRGPHLDRI